MKCVVCSEVLGGIKRKYCSAGCSEYQKARKSKINYRKHKPFLLKRECIFCAAIFRPRNEAHKCCNTDCRNLFEIRKKRQERKLRPKPKPREIVFNRSKDFFCSKPIVEKIPKIKSKPRKPKQKPEIKLEPFPTINSKYLLQIQDFLKNGGEVEPHPPQINGRTPEVNVTNLSGWSVETLYGFGYELELLDELSSTSERTDAG